MARLRPLPRPAGGSGCGPRAWPSKVAGRDIAEVVGHDDRRGAGSSSSRSTPGRVAGRILGAARDRLAYLDRIGLGYLTLDRPARTLSGGEARRVALTAALGSGLVNTLYVLDEPSIGLHPRDVGRLIAAMERLRDAGNSLVVVEHEEAVIRAADHLVEVGPGAGEAGRPDRLRRARRRDRGGRRSRRPGAFLSGRSADRRSRGRGGPPIAAGSSSGGDGPQPEGDRRRPSRWA